MYTQKTLVAKTQETDMKWYVVDASEQVVGRLASQIAKVLRGKHKPDFTPNADTGDFVIVTHCEKVVFTGKKMTDKKYYSHSGYVGGLKERTAQEMLQKHPERVIYNAVKGMLPKTTLGRKQLTKLRVFVGEFHDHDAQKPEPLKL